MSKSSGNPPVELVDTTCWSAFVRADLLRIQPRAVGKEDLVVDVEAGPVAILKETWKKRGFREIDRRW